MLPTSRKRTKQICFDIIALTLFTFLFVQYFDEVSIFISYLWFSVTFFNIFDSLFYLRKRFDQHFPGIRPSYF